MYEQLAVLLSKMRANNHQIMIFVASGHEYLESIAVGFIHEVSPDYVALGDTPDTYTWVIPLDKVVKIEIIGTPDDK
ncbi:MAG: hypothetical protein ACXAEN_18410 [Candidatus Thorarchaeota archaeon]|jgi:hypothetical protein